MLVLALANFVLFQPDRLFEPPFCIVLVYIVARPGQKEKEKTRHKCPNKATFGLFFSFSFFFFLHGQSEHAASFGRKRCFKDNL